MTARGASVQVPLLDITAQHAPIQAEIEAAILEVVGSTRYLMGPKGKALEQAVAHYSGCTHGVGVSSGTDALLASLMALDVAPGDMVVTSPFSFFATIGTIVRLGAAPALVDIDAHTFNLSPEALRTWFETHRNEATRVKAIVPVHLYGQCADMDPIATIAGEYGAAVVEDAAQAIGASYPSKDGVRKAGAMGEMGCFSFYPTKNLGALGDGGMIVTNNGPLADKLRLLRDHGQSPRYYYSLVGGNFRLDEVQAAALLVKLDHLDRWNDGRRSIAAYYDEHLDIDGVETPKPVYGREHHVYNQYVIRVRERRDALKKHLAEHGVGSEVYYPLCFHEQECFRDLGYQRGEFPVSEAATHEVLSLPVFPELTRDQQDYVIEHVRGFFSAG